MNNKLIEELKEIRSGKFYKEFKTKYEERSEKFKNLSETTKIMAYYLLINERLDEAYTLAEDILFDRRVVDIQQFFNDDEYAGSLGRTLRPKWREDIYDFFSQSSDKKEWVFAGSIGIGKSTISNYCSIYCLYRLLCLKNPQATFGLSQASPISCMLLSITKEKAKQVSLRPFAEALGGMPVFKRLRNITQLNLYKGDKIPFVFNDSDDSIKFQKNVHVIIGSNLSHAVGHNILIASCDEVEQSASVGEMLKTYQELKSRITSRFDKSAFSYLSIISSAGNSRGVIPTYIENQKHRLTLDLMFTAYARWELYPDIDPFANGYFWCFKGTKRHPSSIITNDIAEAYLTKLEEIPPNCALIKVPLDLIEEFKNMDINKSIADICGVNQDLDETPFTDLTRLEDFELCPIIEIECNINDIRSLSRFLPDNLFIVGSEGKTILKRYPKEARYLHTDLSINKGSETAMTCCHKEVAEDGRTVYIIDFQILFTTQDKIRLDSIYDLIMDLKFNFNIHFRKVSFDRFASEGMVQKLTEHKIAEEVGISTTGYTAIPTLTIASLVDQDCVKAGRSSKLKNQLYEVKIDLEKNIVIKDKRQSIYDLYESFVCSIYSAYEDRKKIPVNLYVKADQQVSLKNKELLNTKLKKFKLKLY